MTETKITSTARLKRKIKDNVTTVVSVVLIFVVIGIFLAIIQAKVEPEKQEEIPPTRERPLAVYEITETDILSVKNFTSDIVSVMGVMLGDSIQDVIQALGEPDGRKEFPEKGIVNFEYSKRIDLDQTGLIIHFRNEEVARVAMLPPFNSYLKGKTKVDHTKAEIYSMFGVPDDVKHIPVVKTSPILYRLLEYHDYGLEITIRKNKQTGLNLVPLAIE